MSGALELLPIVGEAVNGICNLGANLIDSVVGPEGLFAQTLGALCATNPYRDGDVAPGERALELEAHLVRLERLIAERAQRLLQQAVVLDASVKLGEVAKVLDTMDLSKEDREAAFARVIAFLSNQNIAERLGTYVPDSGELMEELNTMLEQFGVHEHERLAILQQIDDILNEVEERTAA